MAEIWKSKAKELLEDHEAKKQSLVNIPERIRELEENLARIRCSKTDSVRVKSSGGSRDNEYIENIVEREMLQKNLEDARELVGRVNSALSVLSDEEKKLLERFFIKKEREACFNLAEELKIDRKTVYYRKEEALRKFTIAMYGGI